MDRKETRLETIIRLLARKTVRSQQEILDLLRQRGLSATQATLSRDLNQLGVSKVDGCYRSPKVEGPDKLVLSIDTAGPNLVILRTGPGRASKLAFDLDQARIPEIIGTLAGDDTVFLAVKDSARQKEAIRRVHRLLDSQGEQ